MLAEMRKDLNEKLLQRLQAVVVPTLQDADAVSRPKKTLQTSARVLEETEETVGFSKVDHLTHQFY